MSSSKSHTAPLLALLLGPLFLGCSSTAGDSAEDPGSARGLPAKNVSPTSTAAPGALPAGPGEFAPAGPNAAGPAALPGNAAGGVAADAISTPPAPRPVDGVAPANPRVNPFVAVQHDPLSTFAVDVDTASYDIFRRDILNGSLPSPDTVRLEEFVNFFDYDYPMPDVDAAQPFSISLAAAPHLLGDETTLLRVGIQGQAAPEFEKKPANLVFLVDVSGSMQSEEKLPLVKSVLSHALDVLEPEDTVSVVTYASGTQVVLTPTPVGQKQAILGVIEGLSAGGSTNGAGGIQLAYQQARDAYLQGGINHVVLCTDGDFNVGVSDTAGLLELIEEERKTGVTFTALGFGANNNDAMMEAVSNAGNGMYGVIANEDQATTYVHDRLLHNLTLIAKDVKIQVEFNPRLVSAYRLLGYENRAIADDDFRDDRVDAGEIGAEHRVTALYELVLVGQDVPAAEGAPLVLDGDAYAEALEVDENDLVLVKVRYKDVDATEEDEAYEVSERLAPTDVAGDAEDLDADFQWAVAVAAFAEVLKGSPYANAAGLAELAAVFESQAARDAERREFNALFGDAVPLLQAR